MRRLSYEEPGHAHELTFACYRGLPLFKNDRIKKLFLRALDRARKNITLRTGRTSLCRTTSTFLIHPARKDYVIGTILRAIKQPVAQVALREIAAAAPILAKQLTLPDGRRRFWQARGGYDRNLFTADAIHASLDYIHNNPIRRLLFEAAVDWPWSSARWYADLSSNFEVDRCDVVLYSKGTRSRTR